MASIWILLVSLNLYRFLETKHRDHYKVYNLCSEKQYDPVKFNNRVAYYPFDKHNVPPFQSIKSFCEDVDNYLNYDRRNVAVVHGKGGKGRTGVMICAYLLHKKYFDSSTEALEFYANERTLNMKGVTVPSQHRYVVYYADLLRKNLIYTPAMLQITSFDFETIPNVSHGTCSPFFYVWQSKMKIYSSQSKKSQNVTYGMNSISFHLSEPLTLCGDIKVEFYNNGERFDNKKDPMFQFWFNTFFIFEEMKERRLTTTSCDFEKDNLDKANKDKKNKIFSSNFKVKMEITLLDTKEVNTPHSRLNVSTQSRLDRNDEEDLSDTDDESVNRLTLRSLTAEEEARRLAKNVRLLEQQLEVEQKTVEEYNATIINLRSKNSVMNQEKIGEENDILWTLWEEDQEKYTRLERLQEEFQEKNTRVERLDEEVQERNTRLEGLQEEVQEQNTRLEKIVEEYDILWTLWEEDQEKNTRVERLQEEFQKENTRLEGFEKKVQEKITRLERLDGEVQEKNTRLERLQEEFQEKNTRLEGFEEEVQEKNTRLERLDEEVQEKNTRLERLDEEVQEKNTRLEGLQEEVQEQNTRLERLQEEFQEQNTRLEGFEEEVQEKNTRLERLQEEFQEKNTRLEGFEEEVQEKNTRLERLDEEVQEKNTRLEGLQEEVQVQNTRLERLHEGLRQKDVELEELEQGIRQDWTIPREQIVILEKVLGKGGWGWVKEGTFRGTTVAVKQMHDLIVSPHNIRLFEREMRMAASFRHPNLLQFIGATNDGNALFVTERLDNNLRTLLSRRPLHHDEILTIFLDVNLALNYLHLREPPIIHRDISSANVLLWKRDREWRAKVSDYGAANFMQECNTACPGASIYSAPEARTSRQQSPKMDVYSCGVLLCEMCVRELPVPESINKQISLITNNDLQELVRQCINEVPDNRPTIQDILSILQCLITHKKVSSSGRSGTSKKRVAK